MFIKASEKVTAKHAAAAAEPHDSDSDEALMARIVLSDRAAYAALIARHTNRFLALAERLLVNRALAEDVIQDVFLKIWLRADSFNPDAGKFTTWFYRVVTNKCFDEKRRKQTVALPENFEIVDESKNSDATLEDKDRAIQVASILKKLPERQRLAITLCYYSELSNKQAAEIMDLNIKALESLLSRARATLKNDAAMAALLCEQPDV